MEARVVELDIERISQLGEGVGRLDGRAVFVLNALPGERIRAEVHEQGKTLRGELVELLVPSALRRNPDCTLAAVCGGCDFLHADEQLQREAKLEIALSTLEHLGGVPRNSYEVKTIKHAEKSMGYRRRAVLHMVNGRLGFYARKSHQLVAVEHCPALIPALASLPGKLTDYLSEVGKDIETVTLIAENRMVSVGFVLKGSIKPRIRELIHKALARLSLGGGMIQPKEGPPEIIGKPALKTLNVCLPDQPLYMRPDAFLQAHAEGNDLLVSSACELLMATQDDHVLELYSGNGNFTFPVAAVAGDVLAVESSAVSIQLAQRAAREGTLRNIRFVQGDVPKVCDGLLKENKKFQRMLLDPPRSGAPGCAKWALGLEIERIVYVSCDVTTLARDAAELSQAGFQPKVLQLVDMFPQTRHIEAVMSFVSTSTRT